MVNRSLARTFSGDRSPLGSPLRIGEILWQVVGVIDDVRSHGLAIDPAPQAYVDPERFNDAARKAGWDRFGFDATPAFLSFAVRVDGDPGGLVADSVDGYQVRVARVRLALPEGRCLRIVAEVAGALDDRKPWVARESWIRERELAQPELGSTRRPHAA